MTYFKKNKKLIHFIDFAYISHCSPFPCFPQKATFRKKSFTTKVLDTTTKLPISIPLVRQFPKKIGKRSNSIPNLQL